MILTLGFLCILLITFYYISNLSSNGKDQIGDDNQLFNENFKKCNQGGEFAEFIYGISQDIYDLDPHMAWDSASIQVIDQVCEGLFSYNLSDAENSIIPNLASSLGVWSIDKKNYTVDLRTGIKFHDGSVFTASTVKWSFDRLKYFMNVSGTFPSSKRVTQFDELYRFPDNTPIINRVEIINDYTIRFVLNKPYSAFLGLLCFSGSYILSPYSTPNLDYIDTDTGDLVGTGPFVYDGYTVGSSVNFHAFEDYWQGKAKIQNLVFSIIQNSDDRNQALLSGSIDLFTDPLSTYFDTFESDPDITLIEGQNVIISNINMNNNHINRTMRQAISYAINYSYIINEILGGEGIRLKSPLPEGIRFANWSFNVATMNITKARQILLDAGVVSGLDPSNDSEWTDLVDYGTPIATYNYTYNIGNWRREAILYLLQENLRQIGIRVTDAGMEWQEYLWRLFDIDGRSRDMLQIFVLGWGPDYNDASQVINPLFSNISIYNSAQVNDPYLQDLIDEGIKEINPILREQIYDEIQRYIVEDLMPFAFCYVGKNYDAYRSYVMGFQSNPLGKLWLYNVTKTISVPTIETMGVNYVMKSEAILIGEINDDGGTDIIEMRFEWGKTYSCSDSWTNNISVSFLSSFYFHLKGLLPNTTYYFRALAKNSEGWSNGSVKSFTTLDSNAYEWYRTSGGDIGYWSNTIAFDSLDNMYIAGVKRCYLPFQGTEIFLAKFDNLGREQWIYSWKGKDFDLYFCEAIAVDSFNNIYVAGTVSDSIKEDRNIFLVKFDSSGNEKWNLTWGGGDGEMCSGLAVDSNDNVYVAGTTFSFGAGEGDIFLVKYNGFGVQQWFGTWGGSNEDYCRDLVVDSFDDIILGGNTYSFGVGGSDIWLIKLDNSGVEKWNHTWGGTGWEYCYYLAVDSNSNLYVSGQTSSNKLCLIKFDNSGVEKWNRTWNTSDDYYCSGLAVDSNNDVYVTGDFYNYATGDKNTFLIRYNTLGMQQWNRTWGGGNDYCYGLAINSSNIIHIIKYSSPSAYNGDLLIVKYDSLGIQQSYNTWHGTNDAYGFSIAIDSLDNVYSAGCTDTFGNGGLDMYLIKYDNMGTEKWKLTWGKTGNDVCFDIALDGLNNIFLAGYTENFETGRRDMCLVKLDNSGKEQWNITWGISELDVCSSIKLDSSGNIYLAGITKISGENYYQLCLVKFNSLGIYQWSRTFGKIEKGGLWTLYSSCGVAVDSLDNIYLSGSTISLGTTNYDYCLVKYDSSGIQQWSKTWDLSEEDYFSAIELDSSDNVYIAGSVYDSIIEKQDTCLIKYDSLGVQQWNRTWGGDDWYDSYNFYDLTIDSNNNVYVAGVGFQQVTNDYGMFIVKYDTSGNEHWNLTWEGSDFDVCIAIALDSLNNIYLGGHTFGFPLGDYGWEIFVVKFGQSSLPDTLSPNTEIISGPSGIISYNDVIFTWTGSDDITSTLDLTYSYYLEGYDSSWSIWTSNTNKTYDNLPNGDYIFRIQAKDGAGNIEQIPSNQSFTVFATLPPEWGIDKDLVDLINLYSPLYYNDFWNISLSQYKSWIALITLRETGLGRYAAHSQYGCGYEGDKFNHVNAGEDFPFSTGIGTFQLDRGGNQGNANENWGILPTIEKLDPELSLISALRWHQDRFIWVDVNLADFSEYSAWYAVQPANEENFALTWKDITGYEWDQCKANKIDVNFNPPIVFDPFENNVEFLGLVRWYFDNFDGYFDTWLINSRNWMGNIVTQYYYTYREDLGYEMWVYNDPGKDFSYRFERNFTKWQFPEDRVDVGCPSIAGATGLSPALDPDDILFVPGWREDIEPGDILLHNTGSVIDLVLDWTHAGIYVGNDKVVEAVANGVIYNDIDKWDDDKNVALLRVNSASKSQREAAATWAEGQVGKSYSFWWYEKRTDPSSLAWYCSELVWAAYKNIDIDIDYDESKYFVSPDDIYKDDDTNEIGGYRDGVSLSDKFLKIKASCPVDIIIKDPEGLILSKESFGILNSYYLEGDIDYDDDLEDIILFSQYKYGYYYITIIPEENASLTDLFTLEVSTINKTITLCQNLPISDISGDPYSIYASESGIFKEKPQDEDLPGINGYHIILTMNLIFGVTLVTTILRKKKVKKTNM